jgi:hypothetical protein
MNARILLPSFSLLCSVLAACSGTTEPDVASSESMLTGAELVVPVDEDAVLDVDATKPCTGGRDHWDLKVSGAASGSAVLVTLGRGPESFGDAKVYDALGQETPSISGGDPDATRFAFKADGGAVLRVSCFRATHPTYAEPLTTGKVRVTAKTTHLYGTRNDLLAAGFVSLGTESEAELWQPGPTGSGFVCTGGGHCYAVDEDSPEVVIRASAEHFEHPDGRMAFIDEQGVVRGPVKRAVYTDYLGRPVAIVSGLRVTSRSVVVDYSEASETTDVHQLWATGASSLSPFDSPARLLSNAPLDSATAFDDALLGIRHDGVRVGDMRPSSAYPMPHYVGFATSSVRTLTWSFRSGTPGSCDDERLALVESRPHLKPTVRTGATAPELLAQHEGQIANTGDLTDPVVTLRDSIPVSVTMPDGTVYGCF